jgi:hypothetical protein
MCTLVVMMDWMMMILLLRATAIIRRFAKGKIVKGKISHSLVSVGGGG